MADYSELTVDGYIFSNPEDAELAKSEIKKIAYIESHTDLNNMGVVKSVYEKALEERYFQTPIGYEFMRKLKNSMLANGVDEASIKAIPLYTTFRRINISDTKPAKKRVTKAKKEELQLRAKYRNACLIAGILAIVCIVMFFISMNGTTPNAMNYKQAITNQYSSWDAELTEREKKVREKERELNIVP